MADGMDWQSLTPDDSPKGLPDVYTDPLLEKLRTPDIAEGDTAFDFELPVYDFASGQKVATGALLRLSDVAAHRPVALIFGSYT